MTADRLKRLADSVHEAMVAAFHVPETDRYQLITQHDADEIIVLDTGLGLTRTEDFVLLRVTSRARTAQQKQAFYEFVARRLESDCGIRSSDIVVSIIENADEDWSFGAGRAQFLTGELT
jgi:phenylpyruvate tautomerase PptA (4-oxalocrotonate tautomerase family)